MNRLAAPARSYQSIRTSRTGPCAKGGRVSRVNCFDVLTVQEHRWTGRIVRTGVDFQSGPHCGDKFSTGFGRDHPVFFYAV